MVRGDITYCFANAEEIIGSVSAANMKVLKERGYTVIGWDYDSGDTTGLTAAQSNKDITTISKTFPKPHIGLWHFVKADSANILLPNAIKVRRFLFAGS